MVSAESMVRAADQPFVPRSPLVTPTIYVHQEVTWDYKLVVRNLRTDDVPSEADLQELGRNGWELAATITDSPFVYLYFKRPSS